MFIKAGEGEVCVHSTTIRNEPSKESLPNIMLIESLLNQGFSPPHLFARIKINLTKNNLTKKFSHSSLAPPIENLLRDPCEKHFTYSFQCT